MCCSYSLHVLFAFNFWLESSIFIHCKTISHAAFRFVTFLIFLFAVRKLKSRIFLQGTRKQELNCFMTRKQLFVSYFIFFCVCFWLYLSLDWRHLGLQINKFSWFCYVFVIASLIILALMDEAIEQFDSIQCDVLYHKHFLDFQNADCLDCYSLSSMCLD